MPRYLPPVRTVVLALALAGVAALTSGAVLWWALGARLPTAESLKEVRLQVPLRMYTRDGHLIAEIGELRRTPLPREAFPPRLVDAVLAAEDDRFFRHPGVDWHGLTRAAWHLLRTGEKGQGGSTITMQVARNFFLSPEKTFLRKLNEVILAVRIERGLTKDEILALYLNKIYLGHRAYGVAAAAQVYYGKEVSELTLAETAMIAGLPKAPSRLNPVTDPGAAVGRRNYVLGRMLELGRIDQAEHDEAVAEPDRARLRGPEIELEAAYAAEMARAEVVERLGEAAYTEGYRVYTTLDSRLQGVAQEALGQALVEYDERHGYRGPERRLGQAVEAAPADRDALLPSTPPVAGLRPAVVTRVEARQVLAYQRGHGDFVIPWPGLAWARPYVDASRRGPVPARASQVLAPGDVVRVRLLPDGGWRLAQVPQIEGALLALRPEDGAILALGGGLDFARSQFNRATQARRQPGSSFKPFVYSAALEAGYTPATVVNDAPLVLPGAGGGAAWQPENASGRFHGPTRLREALAQSRNLVSVRVLRDVGVPPVIAHAERFGFSRASLPAELSLALGTGEVTPLELAAAYTVFANGGFRVRPYLVDRVVDRDGQEVYRAAPARACPACPEAESDPGGVQSLEGGGSRPAPRVLSAQNAWLMTSMMQDVIRTGTARRALALERRDLAGKTGTTNDYRDAWFVGYNPDLVAAAWVGFDDHATLGAGETGGRAALPMWMALMKEALAGVPERTLEPPSGLVTARIDPRTGLLAAAGAPDAVLETFPADRVPSRPSAGNAGGASEGVSQALF
jgi:penicillin-binding protein 1A